VIDVVSCWGRRPAVLVSLEIFVLCLGRWLATVSKKWEISKKWEKVGLFCGANFQIIFENRQILDTQAKLESKIERCFD
jgi:hypothetical protein